MYVGGCTAGCTAAGCTATGCTAAGCTAGGCTTATGCTAGGCTAAGCTAAGCTAAGCTAAGCTAAGCTAGGCTAPLALAAPAAGCTAGGCTAGGCTAAAAPAAGCTAGGCTAGLVPAAGWAVAGPQLVPEPSSLAGGCAAAAAAAAACTAGQLGGATAGGTAEQEEDRVDLAHTARNQRRVQPQEWLQAVDRGPAERDEHSGALGVAEGLPRDHRLGLRSWQVVASIRRRHLRQCKGLQALFRHDPALALEGASRLRQRERAPLLPSLPHDLPAIGAQQKCTAGFKLWIGDLPTAAKPKQCTAKCTAEHGRHALPIAHLSGTSLQQQSPSSALQSAHPMHSRAWQTCPAQCTPVGDLPTAAKPQHAALHHRDLWQTLCTAAAQQRW